MLRTLLAFLSLHLAILAAAPRCAYAGPSAGMPPINTVFIILEENQNWSSMSDAVTPYLTKQLVPMGASATQYYNPPGLHPSEPNYIWLEAGDNLGVRDNDNPDRNHLSTTDHLVSYLEKAGISWKSYQEDIEGTECPLTHYKRYSPKHNPQIFFEDVTDRNNPRSKRCIEHIRPYSELESDLIENRVARYNFITPNLCNDMHDCGPLAGDTWLSQEVPKILNSAAYKNGGALFITWDEGENKSDGPIGMLVLSPYAKKRYSNLFHYDHSSTLRSMQEIFGVTPFLRGAAMAISLKDLFLDDLSFDTTAPVVHLRSPLLADTVSGTVLVDATASDNIGIVKTELFIDNELKSSLRFPPYTFTWDSNAGRNGKRTIMIKAYDAAGNVASSVPIAVTVTGAAES